ncbi:C4-dicarboxylate transporter DctA [uncultured Sphingomonas sp.]|uniref:C4-dicarboxylate transporter DctA n=1 Tax=uncultured Sphingomonas sp. TaxID=158754 RepID=UPI0035CC623D
MTTSAASPAGSTRAGLHRSLYFWVLVGLAAGAMTGYLFPAFGASLKPLGDAFIKLIKMIIAPVIFCTVVTGIAGMTSLERMGRVGAKALGYFLVFSTLALAVGLAVGNLLRPGARLNIDPATLDSSAVAGYQAKAQGRTVTDFLLNVIPDTAVGAFTSGEVLQTLLLAILFGVALMLSGERAAPIAEAVRRLGEVLFRIVGLIMYAAPVGVFGAMAFTVGNYGLGSLWSLAALVGAFYATSALFVFVVLGAVARWTGYSITALLRYLRRELLLVLGASSSEVALPALIEKLEHAGASRPVVGLVVPTGYSFNLDGTNIYMTMAALFIAQATNTDLSLGDQLLLLGVAMLSSKGAAGVTGAGFVTLAATLSVVPSVPVAGMALILGVDRFMSECRSLTNFIGNAVATLAIARWEGELDSAALETALAPQDAR